MQGAYGHPVARTVAAGTTAGVVHHRIHKHMQACTAVSGATWWKVVLYRRSRKRQKTPCAFSNTGHHSRKT